MQILVAVQITNDLFKARLNSTLLSLYHSHHLLPPHSMLVSPAQVTLHELKQTPRESNETDDLCTTCCSVCIIERRESRFHHGSTTAISFEHLLCAGSITIPLTDIGDICTHHHAGDGLHALNTTILHPYLAIRDVRLFDSISFLMKHRFLVSTFRLTTSRVGIIIRIYLIPYDLPGSREQKKQ